jgi:hypothetical protein
MFLNFSHFRSDYVTSFAIFSRNRCNRLGDKIKEDEEIGRTCTSHMGDKKYIQDFGWKA